MHSINIIANYIDRNILLFSHQIFLHRTSIQQSHFLEQVKSECDRGNHVIQSDAYIYSIHIHYIYTGNIECSKFKEIISYGIGHIGSCPIARQQLALLLELCPKGTTCHLYDPVLSSREREAVERTGCTLLPHNEVS